MKNKYILLALLDIMGNIHQCSFSYAEEDRKEIRIEINAMKELVKEDLLDAISIRETYFLIDDN